MSEPEHIGTILLRALPASVLRKQRRECPARIYTVTDEITDKLGVLVFSRLDRYNNKFEAFREAKGWLRAGPPKPGARRGVRVWRRAKEIRRWVIELGERT